ncbi:MAG: DUF378 domain-containing protein [Sedimentisphaerales bacterium]
MLKLNIVMWVAFMLLVVGGLNWGLVGLLKFDLVARLFGEMSFLTRLVYVAVALSGVIVFVPTFLESKK